MKENLKREQVLNILESNYVTYYDEDGDHVSPRTVHEKMDEEFWSDADIVLQIISNHKIDREFEYQLPYVERIDSKLWENKDFVIGVLNLYPGEKMNGTFDRMSESLWSVPEIALLFLKKNKSDLPYNPEKMFERLGADLWKNKDFVLELSKIQIPQPLDSAQDHRGIISEKYKRVHQEVWENEEFLKTVLDKYSSVEDFSPYIPDRLKENEEFVRNKLKHYKNTDHNTSIFKYIASESLQKNPDFIISLLQEKLIFLSAVKSKIVKDNDDVVRAGIAQHPNNFENASPRLRDNEDMFRLAIEGDARAFRFGSERLRSLPEFFLPAIRQNWEMSKYAIISAEIEEKLLQGITAKVDVEDAKVDVEKTTFSGKELAKKSASQLGKEWPGYL